MKAALDEVKTIDPPPRSSSTGTTWRAQSRWPRRFTDTARSNTSSGTVTKHALTALMRHVATSWGKQGIRSNIVSPGLVLSEKNRNHPEMDKVLANTPSPRLGEPEDLAAAVAMLMSPDGEWINGQILCVDGGVVMR
jgi:NAD(P)-dependent dehydrogenase (short-subunit alcohol dehydrogenase family)